MNDIQSVGKTGLINQIKPLQPQSAAKPEATGAEKPSFAGMVKGFIETVNAQQVKATELAQEVAEGKSDNLVESMTAMEESRLSFQLLLEVRNKVLESLKEIQRMPV